MFTNTYGSFYQENIQILNSFFEKIRSFSVSYTETSMRTIVELFFDELFRVMFKITNPFVCSERSSALFARFFSSISSLETNKLVWNDTTEKLAHLMIFLKKSPISFHFLLQIGDISAVLWNHFTIFLTGI